LLNDEPVHEVNVFRDQFSKFMPHCVRGEVRRMRALRFTILFQLFPRVFPNRFQHAVARRSRDGPSFPDQQAGVDQHGETIFDRCQQVGIDRSVA